jgi:UDP-N-acetylmuramate dehydrogenase
MHVDHLAHSIKSPVMLKEPMQLHTTWKVGGPADIFISLASDEDLKTILKYRQDHQLPLYICGRGSNLLVKDRGIRGMILSVSSKLKDFSMEGSIIKAEGGVALARLVKEAAAAGLTGLEFAAGIPGTVGGAVLMNAGAHGGSMADIFLRAKGTTYTGEERMFERQDLMFAYRSSSIMGQDVIITGVELCLKPGDKDLIREKVRKYLAIRKENQPKEASAGSVFKNPPQGPAGMFIEKAGLKGIRIGGAMISEKHANFIVNTGSARAKDIIALMQKIKDQVYEQFGLILESEVRIIGQ